MNSKEKEVVIIGGGISGLSTGIYARQNGYRATILEMGHQAGGQLTGWKRDGHSFDFCLQWLVGSDHGPNNEVYREIGAIRDDTEVVNHSIFNKMVDETGAYGDFFLYSDADRFETYLKDVAPKDSHGIHKLCNMIKLFSNFEDCVNPPELQSFKEKLRFVFTNGRVFPAAIRYGSKSLSEMLDKLGIRNEKIRFFLDKMTFEPGKDGVFPAICFLAVMGFQHAKNAGYLKGGSADMRDRIVDTFTNKLQGTIKYNAKVHKIIVDDTDTVRGVDLENGDTYLADHVISACDGHQALFNMLDGKYLQDEFKEAYENWPTFAPMIMVGVGLDQHIASECHYMEYIAPSDTPWKIGRSSVDCISIMNRGMYDAGLEDAGKTSLLMSFQSPWELWKDMKYDTAEYEQEKQAIEKESLVILEKQYPGITKKIDAVSIATPLTEVKYTGVWRGAFEGFVPTNTNFGKNLPMELNDLKNFSMVGQWVMPGGGLPPSYLSGRWAIQKLAKKDKKKFKHYVVTE